MNAMRRLFHTTPNRLALLLAVMLLSLAACSVNPVTGDRDLILPGLDESWERETGAKMYAPMRQSQGGDYILDPELTRYVQTVGQRLAAQAKRDLDWEFQILNDSSPNAWALPGGKIAINRGLLVQLRSEAELAAVLGHELVHADASHSAQQQSKGTLTQLGAMGAAILGSMATDDRNLQQLGLAGAQLGAQLLNQTYSREAERESDFYGMQYMSAAGYDPQGAVELQETFVRLSEGRNQDWLSGFFASHPPSRERVSANRRTAQDLPEGGERGESVYQQKTATIRRTAPAYEAFDKARKALAEDRPDEARRLLSEAMSIEPREALFYSLSGDLHASDERWSQAEQDYSRALSRDDSFFYHHLRRGQARVEQNKISAARGDLERSQQLLPTKLGSYLLGQIAQQSGNMEQAVSYYQAAAGGDSAIGQQAARELVLLDLPANPHKYIDAQPVLGQSGTAGAAVRNRAPLPVRNVVLKVEFLDDRNQVRTFSQPLNDTLASGAQTAISVGLQGFTSSQELQRRMRVTVVGAEVVQGGN